MADCQVLRSCGGRREPVGDLFTRESARCRVDERGRQAGEVALGHPVDESGVEVAGPHRGIGEQAPEEGDVRVDAEHDGVGECAVESVEGLRAIGAVRDHLGDHRVVVGGDLEALVDARVDSHALARRGTPREHRTRGREETAVRRLRIDAGLDRVPLQPDLLLREGERLAGGDPKLLLHEVDAGDELRHGVLDLEPGVHLDEEELVGRGIRHQELDRARAEVVDAAGGVARGLSDARPRRGIEQRRGRLLDDLLVTTLQRALALAEVHDGAVGVGEHLHLDVARPLDESLDEQRVVAEGGERDAAGRRQCGGEFVGIAGDLHALAAAARRRLHEQREADGRGRGDEGRVVECGVGDAGHGRHTGCLDVPLRADLVAHHVERFDARTDEHQARIAACLGETGMLREESVARVNRLGA